MAGLGSGQLGGGAYTACGICLGNSSAIDVMPSYLLEDDKVRTWDSEDRSWTTRELGRLSRRLPEENLS